MNLEQVEKKLREADFFLAKMHEQERRAFGDKEPFDFFLSAFLNAARTGDKLLGHQQGATYRTWRQAWDARLSPGEKCLIEFMIKDRNVDVHGRGSRRRVKSEQIPVSGGAPYSDNSGTLTVAAPPRTLMPDKVRPDATIFKPSYRFTIAGTERGATEACAEYLSLLSRMVEQFKADHP
jgi:hypothetical protein